MNDELRRAALQAAVWAVVETRAKELKDEARGELAAGLLPGDTIAGKWDGRTVAKATMARGRARLVVTDEAALVEWLTANHPTELVVTINPAYLGALEERAKTLGFPVDSHGEAVPGVALVEGDPYVSVRKEKGALGLVGEIMAAGMLSLDGIDAQQQLEQIDEVGQ